MKLPYREGTWFGVPLRDSGFGVGLVVRATKKGRILLCYFFGPRRETPPTIEQLRGLSAADATLVQRVGDLGLIRGEWPIIGEQSSWDRKLWPMPIFVRRDPITARPRRVHYSDDDPAKTLLEEPANDDESLEPDGLLGYGAAELLLTKRLNQLSESE